MRVNACGTNSRYSFARPLFLSPSASLHVESEYFIDLPEKCSEMHRVFGNVVACLANRMQLTNSGGGYARPRSYLHMHKHTYARTPCILVYTQTRGRRDGERIRVRVREGERERYSYYPLTVLLLTMQPPLDNWPFRDASV